ncbi:MAG: hypothetical protein ACQETQ_09180 [Spirochaetota bacterium]
MMRTLLTRPATVATLFTVAILGLVAPRLGAAQFVNDDFGYYVDIPESWEIMDASDMSHVAFSSPNGAAVMQILSFSPDRFEELEDIGEFVEQQFDSEGEADAFGFSGREAAFGELSFDTQNFTVRGYHVIVNGEAGDYIMQAFAIEDAFDEYEDELFSALDSVSLDDEGYLHPGPVSQYRYPFPAPNPQPEEIEIEGESINYTADPTEKEAGQQLIEREARILTQHADEAAAAEGRWSGDDDAWVEAWRRFYRMIYRDSYFRISSLARSLEQHFDEEDVPEEEIPSRLLDWFQGFEYSRTGSLSDLLAPVTCFLEETGDCDSLGLAYVIVLQHMGFDAILMVSSEYSHALAGVDVEGEGARFEFDDTEYLLAEFTEDVDMGMIPQSMADPGKWIPVRL